MPCRLGSGKPRRVFVRNQSGKAAPGAGQESPCHRSGRRNVFRSPPPDGRNAFCVPLRDRLQFQLFPQRRPALRCLAEDFFLSPSRPECPQGLSEKWFGDLLRPRLPEAPAAGPPARRSPCVPRTPCGATPLSRGPSETANPAGGGWFFVRRR